MIVPTVRRYTSQQDQIQQLDQHIAAQQAHVDDLSRERARWNDPAYIESQARERLHFVKAGETGYTLTTRQDAAAATHDAQVVGVDAQDEALPWYGKVWGSLEAADRLGTQVRRTPAPGGSPAAPGGSSTPVPTISDTASPAPTGTGTGGPAGATTGAPTGATSGR